MDFGEGITSDTLIWILLRWAWILLRLAWLSLRPAWILLRRTWFSLPGSWLPSRGPRSTGAKGYVGEAERVGEPTHRMKNRGRHANRLLLHAGPRVLRAGGARHRVAHRGRAGRGPRDRPRLRGERRAARLRQARGTIARSHRAPHDRLRALRQEPEAERALFARRLSPALSRRTATGPLRAHRLGRFRHAHRPPGAQAARKLRSRRKAARRRLRHDLLHGLQGRRAGAAVPADAPLARTCARHALLQRRPDGDRPRRMAQARARRAGGASPPRHARAISLQRAGRAQRDAPWAISRRCRRATISWATSSSSTSSAGSSRSCSISSTRRSPGSSSSGAARRGSPANYRDWFAASRLAGAGSGAVGAAVAAEPAAAHPRASGLRQAPVGVHRPDAVHRREALR